jgi:hypothetical protein
VTPDFEQMYNELATSVTTFVREYSHTTGGPADLAELTDRFVEDMTEQLDISDEEDDA